MGVKLSIVVDWCLRLAIYGVVTAVALFVAGVAAICGAPAGAVMIGYLVGGPIVAVIVAEIAVRPMYLPVLVARGRLKRAAMSALGRARDLARVRAS